MLGDATGQETLGMGGHNGRSQVRNVVHARDWRSNSCPSVSRLSRLSDRGADKFQARLGGDTSKALSMMPARLGAE
jgi:hypothetical protein